MMSTLTRATFCLWALAMSSFSSLSQCDMEIIGFDPVDLTISIGVINGQGCGSPTDSIGEFLLGLTTSPQLDDYEYPCFYADGWALLILPVGFPLVDLNFDGPYLQTGDTVTFNLIDAFAIGSDASLCWQQAINDGILFECFVLSIFQINDSDDITGDAGLGGFEYPDLDVTNNMIDFSTVNPDCSVPPPPLDDNDGTGEGGQSNGGSGDQCSDASVWIPNAFSPNNDGKNDVFRPVINCPPECWFLWEFTIYNRWGQKVFESEYPGEQWLGNMTTRSLPYAPYSGSYYVPDGVFTWHLRARHRYGETYDQHGHVTLFR